MPPLSNKDTHLYGAPRTKKTISSKGTAPPSSFSSALSSLISASSTIPSADDSKVLRGRARPTKSDIFTSHNRNSKKRAAADLLTQESSSHTNSKQLDDAAWRRTKRKMEEKARLYAAMKRGDVEDEQERHMVDFDRKWAEKQDIEDAPLTSEDGDDDDEEHGSDQELIDYIDEFGRARKGTRAELAREEHRRKAAASGRDDSDRFTARPNMPTNLIFGDTIQSHAFRPDEDTSAAMEELAAKRDKSLTPPPEQHYDANWEIRTRGTGFFQFSDNAEERKKQMENLEKEREETEKMRGQKDTEAEKRKEGRRKQLEERRKIIDAKRSKLKADQFLDDLGLEIDSKAAIGGDIEH